ncbi:hypothetical protein [Paenibacillus sp. N3.4]|uniref:hypothetical protein n=1 Tax=Paenibacillus sp. N3.4 TaxID=2603222 RepID=UPI0011C88EAA|nr:hypothetical protein [Paenibacillus sp. N3.4]TXK85107.1 hypothetical protein FU659_05000 [Paenibacillus sp. N3.4]
MRRDVWRIALSLTLLFLLLTGCKLDQFTYSSNASEVSSSPESTQVPQSDISSEVVQNMREMQLVMLFQGLLRMDRQPSLAITAKQARDMLPNVRKSINNGSMLETEQKQVMEGLSPEQKKYLDDQAKQVRKHMAERMNNQVGDELTPEEREKLIEAFIQKRKADHPGETGWTDRSNGGSLSTDLKSMGVSVEKQLIELLESKK